MNQQYYNEANDYINKLRAIANKRNSPNKVLLHMIADFFSKQTQSIALFEGLSAKEVIKNDH